jgi:hypothetical protein
VTRWGIKSWKTFRIWLPGDLGLIQKSENLMKGEIKYLAFLIMHISNEVFRMDLLSRHPHGKKRQ